MPDEPPVGQVEVALSKAEPAARSQDERGPEAGGEAVRGDRAEEAAERTPENHRGDVEVTGGRQWSCDRHDDLARQRRAAAVQSHQHDERGQPEAGDEVRERRGHGRHNDAGVRVKDPSGLVRHTQGWEMPLCGDHFGVLTAAWGRSDGRD